MGHQLTIESDEAFALATELAALTGESLDAAVTAALRLRFKAEQDQRSEAVRVMKVVTDFHDLLENPRPSSDHGWLYDEETGLPIW